MSCVEWDSECEMLRQGQSLGVSYVDGEEKEKKLKFCSWQRPFSSISELGLPAITKGHPGGKETRQWHLSGNISWNREIVRVPSQGMSFSVCWLCKNHSVPRWKEELSRRFFYQAEWTEWKEKSSRSSPKYLPRVFFRRRLHNSIYLQTKELFPCSVGSSNGGLFNLQHPIPYLPLSLPVCLPKVAKLFATGCKRFQELITGASFPLNKC